MASEPPENERNDIAHIKELSLANPDVREWSETDRRYLSLGGGMISLRLQMNTQATFSDVAGNKTIHVCDVPRYAFIAVSKTFYEHYQRNPELDSFTFDVCNMDDDYVVQHGEALRALQQWLKDLCTPTPSELIAPGFYAEISLRNICRQLRMRRYLPERSHQLVQDSRTHELQRWQITELLFASSIAKDDSVPAIPEDDVLLNSLAHGMLKVMENTWSYQKQHMSAWLGEEENKALKDAMQRLREKKKKTWTGWQ